MAGASGQNNVVCVLAEFVVYAVDFYSLNASVTRDEPCERLGYEEEEERCVFWVFEKVMGKCAWLF